VSFKPICPGKESCEYRVTSRELQAFGQAVKKVFGQWQKLWNNTVHMYSSCDQLAATTKST